MIEIIKTPSDMINKAVRDANEGNETVVNHIDNVLKGNVTERNTTSLNAEQIQKLSRLLSRSIDLISSGKLPDDLYNQYFSDMPIGFMTSEDIIGWIFK